MRIKWIAYPSTRQEKRESNENSFFWPSDYWRGKTKMVYFWQWFFTERTTKRKQNKEISFQEEGNWIQKSEWLAYGLLSWDQSWAETTQVQVSTWNLHSTSNWSWPDKHLSPLAHASTCGLCSQWYPPVVATVGRRASEKPAELDIVNKSEYEPGSHPATWAALSLPFKPVLRNGPSPDPCVEFPREHHRWFFQTEVYAFILGAQQEEIHCLRNKCWKWDFRKKRLTYRNMSSRNVGGHCVSGESEGCPSSRQLGGQDLDPLRILCRECQPWIQIGVNSRWFEYSCSSENMSLSVFLSQMKMVFGLSSVLF